jgi:hypothetical protein
MPASSEVLPVSVIITAYNNEEASLGVLLSEDHVFRRAVERSGARIIEEPEAISWWSPQVTAKGLFRKTRLYARHNLIAGDPLWWFKQLYGYYAGLLLVVLLVGLLWSLGRGLLTGGLFVGGANRCP